MCRGVPHIPRWKTMTTTMRRARESPHPDGVEKGTNNPRLMTMRMTMMRGRRREETNLIHPVSHCWRWMKGKKRMRMKKTATNLRRRV